MFETGEGVDWATGEALAFGTLLDEGYRGPAVGPGLRARHLLPAPCGADRPGQRAPVSARSTTSASGQAEFEVIDSPLSEAGVLGLRIRLQPGRAQGAGALGSAVRRFRQRRPGDHRPVHRLGRKQMAAHVGPGDAAAARLSKARGRSIPRPGWSAICSSAPRTTCRSCNCTTPANYFHVLRRQMHRNFRKPLIVMTPKSLLRHKLCVSRLSAMGPGSSFHRVLRRHRHPEAGRTTIKRVVLCSGKVYYDLIEERSQARHRPTSRSCASSSSIPSPRSRWRAS